MKLLEAQWDSYRREVITPAAGEVQVTESRRAFYAGAQAMRKVVFAGLSAGSDCTPADEAFMEALFAELDDFERDVHEGRA